MNYKNKIKTIGRQIIYMTSFVIPKNKKIWIFGCWLGDLYCDNPKYLFEYVNANVPDIRAIWVSHKESVINNLRQKGYEAYNFSSIKGTLISMRAKVCFQTAQREDVNCFALGNVIEFQTFHGIPLKRLGNDSKNWCELEHQDKEKQPLSKKIMAKLTETLITYSKTDYSKQYVLTASEDESKNLVSAFNIDPNRVYITGHPRDDAFYRILSDNVVERIKKEKKVEKVILYLPTHRLFGRDGQLISEDDLAFLDHILVKNNFYLLYKPHFNEAKKVLGYKTRYENIDVLADQDKYGDIYEYLPSCDLLITDYSSNFFDYLHINRPIIFYAYDLEWYVQKDAGFYYDYDAFVPGSICKNVEELSDEIVIQLKNDTMHTKRQKAHNFFHKYNDGDSCSRVVEVVKEVIEAKENSLYKWRRQ